MIPTELIPGAQQVVKKVARMFVDTGGVFLLAGFHVCSDKNTNRKSMYHMFMRESMKAKICLPRGMTHLEYWVNYVCGALANQVSSLNNRKLQAVRMAYEGELLAMSMMH